MTADARALRLPADRFAYEQSTPILAALRVPFAERTRWHRLLESLASGWNGRSVAELGPSPHDFTDDGTPFEYSLALEGARWELRVLAEVPGEDWSLASCWQAGRALNAALARDHGIDLKRFERVADLFAPRHPDAQLAMWHSAMLRPGREPKFKLYVDPRANGSDRAHETVMEAARRLGLGRQWQHAAEHVLGGRATLGFVSLDLFDAPEARMKVYVGVGPAELQALAERAEATRPGIATNAAARLRALMHRGAGPRPIWTCCSFTQSVSCGPSAMTFHVPMRAQVSSDAETLEQIEQVVDRDRARILRDVVERFAQRPLSCSAGTIAYFSWREAPGGRLTTTVYLGLQSYRRQLVGKAAPAARLAVGQ